MLSFNTIYINPSNIVYHIRESGVLINGDTLRLVDNKKKYYFEYFGKEEIIERWLKNLNEVYFQIVIFIIYT